MIQIDRNSRGTVALVYLVSLAVVAGVFCLTGNWWVRIPVLALFVWFCRWQTLFHAVPVRSACGSDKTVTAVADGRIVIIDEVEETEWLKCRCRMVSIYMDFWDYHVNYWPVDGEVAYTRYHPGKHFLAFKPKASEDNEHTCTSVRNADGQEIFFKQLAGGFARRIVCYAEPGNQVKAGKQCGIIKFGSRIDMYLPSDADVKVSVGDVVRGAETVIAELA